MKTLAGQHAHLGGKGWSAGEHEFRMEPMKPSLHSLPVVPRYAIRTARPRLVRVARTYSAYASGTYSTQEAGKRSPYVQYGGSGTYVSAQLRAEVMALSAPAPDAQVVSG